MNHGAAEDDSPAPAAGGDAHSEGGSDGGGRTTPSLHIEQAVAALALALVCGISFANVVVRYVTDASFAFTEEYSVVLLVVMTFVGSSLAFARDRHIRMTFVHERLPPRLRRAADRLTLLVTTVVLGLIVFYGARLAHEQWLLEETTPGVGHPAWIYTACLPPLALLMLARAWQAAWRGGRGRR